MQGRCETCKWWGHRDPEWRALNGPDVAPEGWDRCDILFVNRETYLDDPGDGVLMMVDGYEWNGLYTAPEFGCVQWQAREG